MAGKKKLHSVEASDETIDIVIKHGIETIPACPLCREAMNILIKSEEDDAIVISFSCDCAAWELME
ncbi:unnamed protein product, partial [marine sediment metagenome]